MIIPTDSAMKQLRALCKSVPHDDVSRPSGYEGMFTSHDWQLCRRCRLESRLSVLEAEEHALNGRVDGAEANLMLAVEFGYKSCEQGRSLQATLEEATKLVLSKERNEQ